MHKWGLMFLIAVFLGSNATLAQEDEIPSEVEVLAFAGVASNDEWGVYVQEFDGVEMVLAPVGCFMMGSEDGANDEVPVHEQCFSEPFWLDRYEVTNE